MNSQAAVIALRELCPMRFAFLFDRSHSDLSHFYGKDIITRIIETGLLQKLDRPMRISIGDLPLVREQPLAEAVDIYRQAYTAATLDLIVKERLYRHLEQHPRIFTFVFDNMMPVPAIELHKCLIQTPYYLGALDVDFGKLSHLWAFRRTIPEMFRLHGMTWTTFYSMGGDEGLADPSHETPYAELLEDYGFHLEAEDMGARHTVFDDYDTYEHFKRVSRVERIFTGLPGIDLPEISALTHTLEELHPKLFDTFAAAAKVIDEAETEEDLAQAALSGRRVLEQVADYLFPSRSEQRNGRLVGPAQVKNRLWAYIEETASDVGVDPLEVRRLGQETNRIYERFNAGLHARVSVEQIRLDFAGLILWFLSIVDLSPRHARKPYLAYQDNLHNMLQKVRAEPNE